MKPWQAVQAEELERWQLELMELPLGLPETSSLPTLSPAPPLH